MSDHSAYANALIRKQTETDHFDPLTLEAEYAALSRNPDQLDQIGIVICLAILLSVADYTDFRGIDIWRSRLAAIDRSSQSSEELMLLASAADIAASLLGGSRADESAVQRAEVDQMLNRLRVRQMSHPDDDVAFIVARVALEYSEQQDCDDTFQRVSRLLSDTRIADGKPLATATALRYGVTHARCAIRDALRDSTGNLLEVTLLRFRGISTRAYERGWNSIAFCAIDGALLLASAVRNLAWQLDLLPSMSAALNYDWPVSVAVYHGHKTRIHLLRGEYSQALEASGRAVASAALGACPRVELSSFHFHRAVSHLACNDMDAACATLQSAAESAVGRRKEVIQCAHLLAQAWSHKQLCDGEYPQSLRTAMRRAEQLNWRMFFAHLPDVASQLASDALEFEISPTFVRGAILMRELKPPPTADERWPWPLSIRTLGELRVARFDQKIAFSARASKQAELLRRIVEAGSIGATVDDLADSLWPDALGDVAAHNLEVTLARLRKLLGVENSLLLHRQRLVVNPTLVWTDIGQTARDAAAIDEYCSSGLPFDRLRDEILDAAIHVGQTYAESLGHSVGNQSAVTGALERHERILQSLLRAKKALSL